MGCGPGAAAPSAPALIRPCLYSLANTQKQAANYAYVPLLSYLKALLGLPYLMRNNPVQNNVSHVYQFLQANHTRRKVYAEQTGRLVEKSKTSLSSQEVLDWINWPAESEKCRRRLASAAAGYVFGATIHFSCFISHVTKSNQNACTQQMHNTDWRSLSTRRLRKDHKGHQSLLPPHQTRPPNPRVGFSFSRLLKSAVTVKI